ncbi:MAG TPA: ATP-binding cassette domain-containing protein [Candidatus Eisenbergiella merdipullorum]|uniref:ATP-binding cassette domain-containing protein n=1 Tax=Candidatus Eisenbergiella merdipullorum TaxID=2838553 RepID=A0A9D2IA69_9FIRM|nr:ATP-binding cassette domain-containing protein [Candidatus Eisenbergiella merdipullorum]
MVQKMKTECVISVEKVSKDYRFRKRTRNKLIDFLKPEYEKIRAVSDVTFKIYSGESVGLIGKNGAGKSTLIKMMAGILYPSNGTIRVNGLEPYKNRTENAKYIGVVFGQRSQLWWDIPILESFRLFQKMYRIPRKDFEERLSLFQKMFGMENYMTKPVRQLSLGQRMCADLCASMLHNPPVLFMDEPTIGLDVLNKENMRNFVKEVNLQFGTTIILTSHDLDDIEELCQRMILIDNGKMLFDGSLEGFERKASAGRNADPADKNLEEAVKIYYRRETSE